MIHTADRPPTDEDRSPPDRNGEALAAMLADPHCRHLVSYLRETDGPATVATVSTYVVAQITGTAPDNVPSDVQRRVQTWLHHGQLPKLADHGVVAFDPDDGTVELAAEGPLSA